VAKFSSVRMSGFSMAAFSAAVSLSKVCALAHMNRPRSGQVLLGHEIALLCGRGGAMVAAVQKGESSMLHSSAAQRPLASPTQTSCYPDDLLPELQTTLAALADLEVRYEKDQEQLTAWAGPNALKERFAAQLEEHHQRERMFCVQRLNDLHHRTMRIMAL